MTNNSVLVYSTDTPPVFEPEPCLGSQGIISTSQCCNLSERLTGEPCPLCVL
jgi:hypothetical protein